MDNTRHKQTLLVFAFRAILSRKAQGTKKQLCISGIMKGDIMGTINYGKSEYITMGFENPVTAYELLNDSAWVESERRFLLDECDFEEDEIEDALETSAERDANLYFEDDIANISFVMRDLDLRYFEVSLEYGYYDGAYIDIDFGRDIWDEEDKQAAIEEVEQIRAFLHECNGLGMRACYPHWVTHFDDFAETEKEIEKAYVAMRADIMEIGTSEDGTA